MVVFLYGDTSGIAFCLVVIHRDTRTAVVEVHFRGFFTAAANILQHFGNTLCNAVFAGAVLLPADTFPLISVKYSGFVSR